MKALGIFCMMGAGMIAGVLAAGTDPAVLPAAGAAAVVSAAETAQKPDCKKGAGIGDRRWADGQRTAEGRSVRDRSIGAGTGRTKRERADRDRTAG